LGRDAESRGEKPESYRVTMSTVLGLNWGHDGAAALVRNGRLVSAIAKERLTRRKKDEGISRDLITYVLEEGEVTPDQLSAVAFAAFVPSEETPIRIFRKDGTEVTSVMFDLFGGRTFEEFVADIDGVRLPAFFINHHIAHCAAAFYTSPFEQAACLSVDASMFRPEACSVIAWGDKRTLNYHRCPGIMIGNAYSIFTEKLGLGPGLTKAGTLMGLAPYGKPNQVALERWREFGTSFHERAYKDDPRFIQEMWCAISLDPEGRTFLGEESDSAKAQEIAASIQYVFEETLVEQATRVCAELERHHGGNLCLAGGSFLNSETNMSILRRSGFDRLHLFPGCGDDGTAVGAALFTAHSLLGDPRLEYSAADLMYLGRSYATPAELAGSPLVSPEEVACRLANGDVVGLCQGRAEFGPRALGNRSLLADPRSKTIRDHINANVKHREWFRPFAPVVLAEQASEWFDLDVESPFMLLIAKVKRPDELPAVSHIDGTARVQTLRRDDNPTLYAIIEKFAAITGVPVLLNTSMNGNGEPLVETPADALRFLRSGVINSMVINNRLTVG
jgi:carbamoyltransferase